jgi:N-acetylglucosamine-6-phosphate deacetylase
MALFVNATVIGHAPRDKPSSKTIRVRTDANRIVEVGNLIPAANEEIVDLDGDTLAPGFVDIQCNGALGIDLVSQPHRLWEFATQLPRWGVTSVLPTFISSPLEISENAQIVCAHTHRWDSTGARVLGLHLEGPMLNPKMSGAHPVNHLRPVVQVDTVQWTSPVVALVTIAPELPNALEQIRDFVARGIIVSLGHSAATADQVCQAIQCGATAVTHLFNAMSPLHHRDLGLAGMAMHDDRLTASIICDGVHVDPDVVRIAWKLLGKRLILITDAVSALGMPEGEMRLGDTALIVSAHAVRLADGTLAGSKLSMDAAVRNLMAFSGCTLDAAVYAASTAPALLLGRTDIGAIEPGRLADLVVLSSDGFVRGTWVGGRQVYQA